MDEHHGEQQITCIHTCFHHSIFRMMTTHVDNHCTIGIWVHVVVVIIMVQYNVYRLQQ